MNLPGPIQRLLGLPSQPRGGAPDAPSPPPATPSTTSNGGFQHNAHNSRAPLGWRIGYAAAIVLVVGTGLWHLFGLPIARAISGPPAAPPPVETIDTAAAASLAAAFTGDYWSYSSHDPAARAAALLRWTGDTSTIDSIDGAGQLRTDLVTTGTVITEGTDVAVVQTRARVTPAWLSGAEPPAPERAAKVTRPEAADPGPADGDPWTANTPLWLSLDVVVHRTGGQLAVTGATLTGDAPSLITRPTTETDAQLTGQTNAIGLPEDILGAYAAGDGGQLSYLTTTDVQLDGLSGAVALADVAGWSMATDRADNGGPRYVSADVTWSLTGTQITIPQSYALTLTDADGRWLLGSIGPRIEENP